MNRVLVLLCLCTLLNSRLPAQVSTDTVLYSQRLYREGLPFAQYVKGSRGTLYLTLHKLQFRSFKTTNSSIDFNVTYQDIESIRAVNYLIFPNRILIKTKVGKLYRLYTYKRKRILETVQERILFTSS